MSSAIADIIDAADKTALAYKGAKIQLALIMSGKLNRGTASGKNMESMKAVMQQLLDNKSLPYALEVVRAADMKISSDFAIQLQKRDGGSLAHVSADELSPETSSTAAAPAGKSGTKGGKATSKGSK